MDKPRVSDEELERFVDLVIDGTNFQDLALDLRDARVKTTLLLEYIELMAQELDTTSAVSRLHGWQSNLVEEGIQMRARLAEVGCVIKGEK